MAKINPNEYAREGGGNGGGGGGEKSRSVGAGRKVLLPIGHYSDEVNEKPVVKVRSVCLVDLDQGGDEGAVLNDTFWLTSNALWRIAGFALATGHTAPFDPEVSEDMEAVLASGPFETTVTITQRGGKEYANAVSYKRTTEIVVDEVSGDLELTPGQRSAVENAEAGWAGLMKWLAGNRSGGGRSGGGSSGGNGEASGGGGRGGSGSVGRASRDDIPF